MADLTITVLLGVAAAGSGMIGGVFFTFSNFVMNALERLSAEHGAEAMQHINVTVQNPAFFTAFFGTGVLAVTAAVVALASATAPAPPAAVAGAALYIVGSVGVTIAFNVPLNERLGRSQPEEADRSGFWRHYLRVWTRWNHVRTIASLVAAVLFIVAAC